MDTRTSHGGRVLRFSFKRYKKTDLQEDKIKETVSLVLVPKEKLKNRGNVNYKFN